jgi:hypothetical protein
MECQQEAVALLQQHTAHVVVRRLAHNLVVKQERL